MSEERPGKLLVGMLGWSAENIAKDDTGLVWFPTGEKDPRWGYGFKWAKQRVKAIEEVRAHVEVIVVDENLNIKEHTPVEVKILGYIYDDSVVVAYNPAPAAQTRYIIGTAARAADPAVPAPFVAELVFLEPTTACFVRFETNTRVQHPLAAGVRYRFMRRCRELFFQSQPGAPAGTITITSLGNEVGI